MVNTGNRSKVIKDCGVLLKFTKYLIMTKYLVQSMVGKSSLISSFYILINNKKIFPGFFIIEEMFGDYKY
jgi:hypothetical protein